MLLLLLRYNKQHVRWPNRSFSESSAYSTSSVSSHSSELELSASQRYPLSVCRLEFLWTCVNVTRKKNPIRNPKNTHINTKPFYFLYFTPVLALLNFFFCWRNTIPLSEEINRTVDRLIWSVKNRDELILSPEPTLSI